MRFFCCRSTRHFFDYFFDPTVSISEDSETFLNLLSFIYPDKTSAVFTSLDALLPVLNAANKYQMRAVVDALKAQIMSTSVSGNTYREALLYDDPLRVYAKAKELNLGDLANAAASATLNIDITCLPDAHSHMASMPAMWLWQLLDIRKERTAWLLAYHRYNTSFVRHTYQPCSFFRAVQCGCGKTDNSISKEMPALLLDRIKANPCPRAIRKIDFIGVLNNCSQCGAAAAVHFNKICTEYEKRFGMF